MELARLSLRAVAVLAGPTDGARDRERERWDGEGVCLYWDRWEEGSGCVSKRMEELRGATAVLKWPECVWRGMSVWEGYMSVAEEDERARA